MKVGNYQPNQNPYFGARFINKLQGIDMDSKKVGKIFEKLTKDCPKNKLILESQNESGLGGDIFKLTDYHGNKLAKINCLFTKHSQFEQEPVKQASLLNNIFRFMQQRENENIKYKELGNKISNEKIKYTKLQKSLNELHNKQDELLKAQEKNIMNDMQKYNIEIDEIKSNNSSFEHAYKMTHFVSK